MIRHCLFFAVITFAVDGTVVSGDDVDIPCLYPCYSTYSTDLTACGVPDATLTYEECNTYAFGNKSECLSACGEDRPSYRKAGFALARVFKEAGLAGLLVDHDNFTEVLNATGDKLLSIDILHTKFLNQARARLGRVKARLEAALSLAVNAPAEVTDKLTSDIAKVTIGIEVLTQITAKPCFTSIANEIESNEDTIVDILVDLMAITERVGFPWTYRNQNRRAWNKVKQARRLVVQTVAIYQKSVVMGRRKANQAIRVFDALAEDLVISADIVAAAQAEIIEYRTEINTGLAISQCLADTAVP